VLQVLDASTSLPHEVVLALDNMVEQMHVSSLPTQLTIKGAPTMLSLETSSNFMATSLGIHVHKRNEVESSSKRQVKKQEVHIIKNPK
jgi:hypothetical protein